MKYVSEIDRWVVKFTWRWFGPDDPVTLSDAIQAGATGIVSSLHDIPDGVAWTPERVKRHQGLIEAAGLEWTVVESIPVCNQIKSRASDRQKYLDNYKTSMRAVAAAGIKIVCYNFIPLVDWVRTDLRYPLKSGLALRFDMIDFVACDLFILKRPGADYPADTVVAADQRFQAMSAARKQALEQSVLAPLPGGTMMYSRAEFFEALKPYVGMTAADYSATFLDFQREIIPVAEELGIRMAIHPDDPPLDLFGLPRIAGTAAKLRRIVTSVPSAANGITFCVGSLGVLEENDLPAMVRDFAEHIHFGHMRNVRREGGNSFHEAEHMEGSSDMVAILDGLLREESRRKATGREDHSIPIRPDHGHLMLDDIGKANVRAGYPAIGRLKGMAELKSSVKTLQWLDARRGA